MVGYASSCEQKNASGFDPKPIVHSELSPGVSQSLISGVNPANKSLLVSDSEQ
jgi:hypothetical protein